MIIIIIICVLYIALCSVSAQLQDPAVYPPNCVACFNYSGVRFQQPTKKSYNCVYSAYNVWAAIYTHTHTHVLMGQRPSRVSKRALSTLKPLTHVLKLKSLHQRSVVTFLSFWRDSPPVGHDLFFHEVSISHTTTHHSRYDSSGRVISSSQRPLPDNTQHSTTDRYPYPRWDSKPQSQ